METSNKKKCQLYFPQEIVKLRELIQKYSFSSSVLRSLPVSAIPERFRNNYSCDTAFFHEDSQSDFTRIFILHENIRATCVVTSCAEEVDTMFINNLEEDLPCE